MLYITGVCCNCNICYFCNILISGVKKNNNCYDLKISPQYNVDILILIKITVYQNVGRVCTDLHIYRVHILVRS